MIPSLIADFGLDTGDVHMLHRTFDSKGCSYTANLPELKEYGFHPDGSVSDMRGRKAHRNEEVGTLLPLGSQAPV